MPRPTPLLLCAVLSLALPAVHTPSITSAAGPHGQPDPANLLGRADTAMQSVHSLHAVGRHTSTDRTSHLDVRIVGNCSTAAGTGIPFKAGARIRGIYAPADKPARPINIRYALTGRFSPPGGMAWHRSAGINAPWVHSAFDTAMNGAYTRQICPALIRATYIHGYLSGAGRSPQRMNLGMQTIAGYPTWHVRQVLGYTLDYFIDAQSYEIRRLTLSGNLGTTWQETFDYSRFNAPIGVEVPPAK